MVQIDVASSQKKKCSVCGHKTQSSAEYGYVDGISVNIPVCDKCKEKTGCFMNGAMDAQLKSISSIVRMSTIITYDENRLRELYKKGVE